MTPPIPFDGLSQEIRNAISALETSATKTQHSLLDLITF
jgi:hypothetical protein